MSLKINPPDLGKSKSYENYKNELLAWKEVTSLELKKQGIAVALSLPEDHVTDIRDKVFDEITLDELKVDTGLTTLITFLDKILGKDDLADSYQKYVEFEECKRQPGQSMNDFILQFDQKHKKLVKLKINFPSEIVAFKIIREARLTNDERLIVMTGLDFEKRTDMYEAAKKSLKKYKGVAEGEGSATSSSSSLAIKLEPSFLAENEEALFAAGYTRKQYVSNGSSQFRGGRFGSSQFRGGQSQRGYNRGSNRYERERQNNNYDEGRQNTFDRYGKVRTCYVCGSTQHLARD